jgi:PAS domain S-box-containing protein
MTFSLLVDSETPMFDSRNKGNGTKGPPANVVNVGSPIRGLGDIDLSRYAFEALRQDEEFVLSRGTRDDGLPPLLMVAPAVENPAPEIITRFEHAYALRNELDPASVARPAALVHHDGLPRLLIEDFGGDLLERLLGQPLELPQFLRVAIGVAVALGRFHAQGLIHRDVNPANILVNPATGEARLMGICLAPLLRRQRQITEPLEMIAGAVAYMAPEQTGRMNRSIDSRSDLYSLGVTLYEMLTGSLPFTASDPMEWVHCHIARQPIPPGRRLKTVPVSVSAIVMKLLAKTAEERYQTAAGVESDLQRCLVEWEAHHRIDEFPLGERDMPDRLLIPEKLYGRTREIDALLVSFERVVASGTPEFVLVSGYSGVGKTSVVNELRRVLVPLRGLFASGKFDQYKRDIPYATLAKAFQTLVRQILGMSDAEVSRWRKALCEALGSNGQLIVNLIPELELIIGKQPSISDLPPEGAQNRFQMVFRQFLSAFARAEHPLALFLDDLQWLDAATLELLEHLITEPDVRYLLLVGAYRDNEVSFSHPLPRMLEEIRMAGVVVEEIILAPFSMDDIHQLVVDSLHCELHRAEPLAQLIYAKTGGNPFFAIQFLTELAEEGLLAFDSVAAAWTWDLPRIRAKGFTDNVADLMTGKLGRLPDTTQEALKHLACLGNSAGTAFLSMVQGDSEEALDLVLREPVRAGLVFHLDGAYAFVHDRVREAAYGLIPESERAATHLRIGRLLVSSATSGESEDEIFEIVNQLNRAAALITASGERARVAELNLAAGKRAKTSAAYGSALNYFAASEEFLPENCWDHDYALAFDIALNRAECEFLTGLLTDADERLSRLSERAANPIDHSAVACVRVALYTTEVRFDRAVEVCLDYLRQVGVAWSPHPTKDDVIREHDHIRQKVGDRSIEQLVDLPLMIDPACRATLDILSVAATAAWLTDQNLHDLVVGRMVNLSLEHGNSDGSCYAYAVLGTILASHFGQYQAGYRFGKLGIDLVAERGLDRFRARVYSCFGHHVIPWTRHLRNGRVWNRRAFDAAKESGDLAFAAFSASNMIANLIAGGEPLEEVQREAENGLEFARKMRFGLVTDYISGHLGFIKTLRGRTPKFGCFDDGNFDERLFERHLSESPCLAFAAGRYWIRKLQARFYAGDYASAITSASKVQLLLRRSQSFFEVAEYPFYSALVHAAAYAAASMDDKAQHRAALVTHYQQIEIWAENCPENFGGYAALVAAEISRIEGRELDAEQLYEKAILGSRAQGFIQNEAIANELAARFYSARGLETIARTYLRNGRYCYFRWGALGKVQQLEQLYPSLKEAFHSTSGSAAGTPIEQVDVLALGKAAQAVSSELDLDKLIEKLLTIALENAGAQRGLLILLRNDEPQIEAEAITSHDAITVNFRQAFPTPVELPDSILRYVIRTQENIILDDASTPNQFSADEYVQKKHARSVLCLPLVKQANLKGALYLENNLASHVFTPDRILMLRLLVSQASISLDHARLYADLTQENSDRRRAEEALRASEERLQDIVDNTSAVIFVKDLELRYLLVNREYERRHNVRRDEIRGKTDFDIHPYEVAETVRANDMQVIEADAPIQFEEVVPSEEGNRCCISAKFLLRDREGKPYAVCGIATDITEVKQVEEMRAALARERELLAEHRAAELAKANKALRGCLDALASVPDLDEFLGQVMAVITQQLGAASSMLGVLNLNQSALVVELLFQDGRVMSPEEARYPEFMRSLSLDEQQYIAAFLDQPTTVSRILDPHSPIPERQRSYLLELGIKTLLIIPLTSGGLANGLLTFRFTEERDFHPEELEIARALAIQASLAIQFTRLAKTARQSAVLKERNRLAGEIHDALAQSFAGISMQLEVAEDELATKSSGPLSNIRRANEMAKFGLAEARRSLLCLRSSTADESGFVTALQCLVERSNVRDRLRCDFRSNRVPDKSLSAHLQHELLRIAQETISNAVRHAKATVVTVSLHWDPSVLVLQVKDNGSGICPTCLKNGGGFGLVSMRERVAQIDAKLEIQTAAGHGTTVVVTVPI